jgi:hypothetical protein
MPKKLKNFVNTCFILPQRQKMQSLFSFFYFLLNTGTAEHASPYIIDLACFCK